MDELAHDLEIDPVELRLMNHGPNGPRGNPWSSDGLPECLRRGAEPFCWDQRDPTPRSQRDGNWLIGHGMAAAGYPVALFMPEQQARARIYGDGSAVIEAGTPEFGTGVGTTMTQVAADALGLQLEALSYKLGDSDLPNITSAVGSAGSTMVSAAVLQQRTTCAKRSSLRPSRTRSRRSTTPIRALSTSRMGGSRSATSKMSARAMPSCSVATDGRTPKRSGAGDRRRSTPRTGY
jgi:xanthine dehydrogenase YagR molybdenum-binding subunit